MVVVGEITVIFIDEGSLIVVNVGTSWIVVVKYGIFIVVGIRGVCGDGVVIDEGVRGCPHDFDI